MDSINNIYQTYINISLLTCNSDMLHVKKLVSKLRKLIESNLFKINSLSFFFNHKVNHSTTTTIWTLLLLFHLFLSFF